MIKITNIRIFAVVILVALLTVFTGVYYKYLKFTIIPTDFESVNTNVKLFNAGVYGDYQAIGKVDENGDLTNEEIKIIAFTDTHIGQNDDVNKKTLDKLVTAITTEKPDLVIFCGDNVLGFIDEIKLKQFAELMEDLNVYWCAVLGNHDAEGSVIISRKKIVEIWSGYEHCLMEAGSPDIYGYGNYVVNLVGAEGVITQSMIFLDSGDYISAKDEKKYNIDGGYDFIKQSQIDWYKSVLGGLNEGRTENIKSMVFFHIPLLEYTTAYDNATEESLRIGDRGEAECCSKYNSGMFQAVVEMNSTQAVFCGHDHLNDYAVEYQGVYLGYVQSSGYSTYGDDKKRGYSEFTLNSAGELVITQHKYED